MARGGERYTPRFNDVSGSILDAGRIAYDASGRMLSGSQQERDVARNQLDDVLLEFLLFRRAYKERYRHPKDRFPTRTNFQGQDVVLTQVTFFRGEGSESIHAESRNPILVSLRTPIPGQEPQIREFQTDLHRLAEARSRRTDESISGSGFVNSSIVYREAFNGQGAEDVVGTEEPSAYAFRSVQELLAVRSGLESGRGNQDDYQIALGVVLNRLANLQSRVPAGDIAITQKPSEKWIYIVSAYGTTMEVNINELTQGEKRKFLAAIGQQSGRRQ